MEIFETALTGSDGLIDGIVTSIIDTANNEVYQFTSLDGSLYLTITRDETGKWIRIAGSDPYFSGWTDELSEKITHSTTSESFDNNYQE